MSFAFFNNRPSVPKVAIAPDDGVMVSTQIITGSGLTQYGSGVVLASGTFTTDSMSLWTTDGIEVSMNVVPLLLSHSDGSHMGVYLQKLSTDPHGTRYWLRTRTPPQVAREPFVTQSLAPYAFWVQEPGYVTKALPDPYKLPTWDELLQYPDQSEWAQEYMGWITYTDWPYASGALMTGGLRNAIYCRAHSLASMGYMTGDARWSWMATRVISWGTPNFVGALSSGNVGVIGNETTQDPTELFYTYLLSGHPAYMTAMTVMASQLTSVTRTNNVTPSAPDGTYYNLLYGWDRSVARAWQATGFMVAANLTTHSGDFGYGNDSNGVPSTLVGSASYAMRIKNITNRVVSGTGIANDQAYFGAGTVLRSITNPTQLFLSATLPQRNPDGSSASIAPQEIGIDSGCDSPDNGFLRVISTRLVWNGTNILTTSSIWSGFAGTASAGTTTRLTDSSQNIPQNMYLSGRLRIVSGTGAGQSSSIVLQATNFYDVSPAFSIAPNSTSIYTVDLAPDTEPNRRYLPNIPSGTRDIGHSTMFISGGVSFVSGVTPFPPVHSVASGGLLNYLYCNTRELGHKPYMLALTMNSAIQYIHMNPGFPSMSFLEDTVELMCTYLYDNFWRGTPTLSFAYGTIGTHDNGHVNSAAGQTVSYARNYSVLNTLMARPMSWLGWRKRVSNPVSASLWATRAKDATDGAYLASLDPGTYWWNGIKTINQIGLPYSRIGDEAHAYIWNTFYYRNQVI